MNSDRFKFRVWREKEKRYVHDSVFLGDVFSREDCDVIEQCTGLRDKNGKLIYEGDIVRDMVNHNDYIVKWSADDAAFFLSVKEGRYFYFPAQDKVLRDTEIVGNVHEGR